MTISIVVPDALLDELERVMGRRPSAVLRSKTGTQLFEVRRTNEHEADDGDSGTFWLAPARHPGWATLRKLVDAALPSTRIEVKNRWRKEDDEWLWRCVVGQVAAVGGSRPTERMGTEWETLGIGFADLVGATDVKVRRLIHKRFRQFAVRYVGQEPGHKEEACVRNLRALRAAGGPRAFFAQAGKIKDDAERIAFVMNSLAYIKKKGARDLLMGTGLLRDSIALDARVVGALKDAGVVRGDAAAHYDVVERAVIENVAVPLGVEPVAVDRAIYQMRGRRYG